MTSPVPPDGVILLDPHPRRMGRIFDDPTKRRLERLGRVLWHDGSPAAAEQIDRHLPETIALIGQSPMDRTRLDRAPRLRAIFNVESNFLPNVDYSECDRRGIPVLSTAPVYAQPVAELALAMAISLARRMHEADAALRVGREFKGDNHDSFLLHGKPLALIGFGNLGRALLPLLRPLSREILVHDPWIAPSVLQAAEVIPASLDECFARSRVVFIVAANTTENTGLIGGRQFASMQPGSVVILASRAALVNFPELLAAAGTGQIRAGIDVWPEEPIPPAEPGRNTPNTLIQAHRRRQCARDPDADWPECGRRPRGHPRRPAAPALPAGRSSQRSPSCAASRWARGRCRILACGRGKGERRGRGGRALDGAFVAFALSIWRPRSSTRRDFMKILFIGGSGVISRAAAQQTIAGGHELWLLNRGTRRPIAGRACDRGGPRGRRRAARGPARPHLGRGRAVDCLRAGGRRPECDALWRNRETVCLHQFRERLSEAAWALPHYRVDAPARIPIGIIRGRKLPPNRSWRRRTRPPASPG
jgi:phosphoglycerate dehydrogenase-like enzyme